MMTKRKVLAVDCRTGERVYREWTSAENEVADRPDRVAKREEERARAERRAISEGVARATLAGLAGKEDLTRLEVVSAIEALIVLVGIDS